MKKNILMMLMLSAGAFLSAENTAQNAAPAAAQKPQVCASNAKACELTADEQAFVAKLNDTNRKAFTDKLTAEQRKAVMLSTKNGGNADEAVAKLASSQASSNVATAEKANPNQSKK